MNVAQPTANSESSIRFNYTTTPSYFFQNFTTLWNSKTRTTTTATITPATNSTTLRSPQNALEHQHSIADTHAYNQNKPWYPALTQHRWRHNTSTTLSYSSKHGGSRLEPTTHIRKTHQTHRHSTSLFQYAHQRSPHRHHGKLRHDWNVQQHSLHIHRQLRQRIKDLFTNLHRSFRVRCCDSIMDKWFTTISYNAWMRWKANLWSARLHYLLGAPLQSKMLDNRGNCNSRHTCLL